MCSVTASMNLATFPMTAPTRFFPQEHHATKTDLIYGIDVSTPKETDHTRPTLVTDMGDISTDHSHATIPTVTGEAAVSEGTHCTSHPHIAAAHAALQLMHVPITICAMTHPTGIVTPYPTLTNSPSDVTHMCQTNGTAHQK